MSSSADVANVDWFSAHSKRMNDLQIRERLLPYLSPRRPFRGITFPAAAAIMERDMAQDLAKFEFEFLGIEQNPKIYKIALSINREFRRKFNNLKVEFPCGCCSFKHFLNEIPTPKNENERFDLVYPDYMGTWSSEKRSEIESIFRKRLLRRNGFLAMTIMLARGRPETFEQLQEYMISNYVVVEDMRLSGDDSPILRLKTQGVPRLVEDLAKQAGITLVTRRVALYSGQSSRGQSCSEISYLFQVLG